MKTTVDIDDDLLREVSKIYKFRTKRETIEAGLRELIAAHKRKALAGMFGQQKNIQAAPRRPA
ncbi:MAG: type II toxin-antitoxin system VapB family antitoxin [Leptospiraceae bacterium]